MRRTGISLWLVGALVFSAHAAVGPARQVRIATVDVAASAVPDLIAPDGKSRWDLAGVTRGATRVRSLEIRDDAIAVSEAGSGPAGATVLYADPLGGDAALRWLFPDRFRDQLRMGSRQTLRLEERSGEASARLRVDAEIIGIGWIHLPAGPREVVLQRSLVVTESGANEPPSTELIDRWIDPLAGVVAEAWGAASGDGRTRLGVRGATVVEEVLAGAADLRIYADELWQGNYHGLNYGWDKGTGTAISSLTTPSYTTMGDLIAASTWDFSATTSGKEIGSTTTPINSSETCNAADPCGYATAGAGAGLERTDENFDQPFPTWDFTNDVAVREDRTSDVTIWIRAGSQHEHNGIFDAGPDESRFCYDPTTGRTEVPLWRFSNHDAGGWYLQAGDSWISSPAFNCQQDIFTGTCGGGGTTEYINACTLSGDPTHPYSGTQGGAVLKGGVVTIPSGHTFNALLVRNLAEFCVWLDSGCRYFNVSTVRTSVYLWQVPHLGSVVMLQSPQAPQDTTSFTTVDLTNLTFGLYPPRSITVTGATDTSVTLSWDPGRDTHRISGYKVYWDTDSGAATPYANNQPAAGTSATINGLTACTPYFLTVTSLSNFRDPSSLITTTYESLLYPTQVSGDPSYVYPVEVQATAQCKPGAEVGGLTVAKSGADVQICWSAASDPCLQGYRILGAASPATDAGFSTVADVGATTCWTGSTAQSYFLVVARGSCGTTGPWGHYGH